MKKVILKAEEVCKSFAAGGRQNHVLDMVDVEIYEGDFTVVMGSSGAGKSTLLYALSGMDKATRGRVWYGEREIGGLREREMAALRAVEFGFVFQQIHLVSNLTLLENVAVAGYLKRGQKTREVRRRAEELLVRMHVEEAKDRLPSQVSGGEAQRAAIARAVMNEPGLVFADEPTGALNRRSTEEVLGLLSELNEGGQSILMVTHDVRAAIRGNRFLYLADGKIMGEMTMPSYSKAAEKDRGRQIDAWLDSMSW